jgi:hypothetical protein
MPRTAVLVLVLKTSILSAPAFAQSGTPAEQRACRHDVTRYCRAVMHESEARVTGCLVLNAANISKACQQVLRAHGRL